MLSASGAAEAEREWVVIEVLDQGIGMSPEELTDVFALFRQGGAQSRGRHPQGLGVGLALAKHVVELHGGSISASSAGRNLGSRFTIRLPRRA